MIVVGMGCGGSSRWPNITPLCISLLAIDDLYFLGSTNFSTVVLCVRESISFWVPSSPMESSSKSSFFNDLFLSSISANAVAPFTPIRLPHKFNSCSVSFVDRALANWHAPSESILQLCRRSSTRVWFVLSTSANSIAPLTPIGLRSMSNFCSVSFVHKALANWHALSESMSHLIRLRSTRVWFVLSTEASEMVFWREKCELHMPNLLSVLLWWSPLIISSTASGRRG